MIGLAWTIAVDWLGMSVLTRIQSDTLLELAGWILVIPSGALGWIPGLLMSFNEREKGSVEFRIERAKEYIEALETHGDRYREDFTGDDPRDTYKVPIMQTMRSAVALFTGCSIGFVVVVTVWQHLKH